MGSLFSLILGFFLDFFLGDPHWMPHPVRMIGWLIAKLEQVIRRLLPKGKKGELFGGFLLVVLVLPKEKDGHLPSVFQMLYDLFSPKTLVMEKLLQILYVFLTCLAVLYGIVVFFSGFFSGFQNLALGLVILAVGPILLRVGYELILLLVMQVKTTREIHQKLTQMTEERGPAAAPGRPQPAPETAAPAAEKSAVPCRENQAMSHCPACGTWYRAASDRCPVCGRQPEGKE